ncbi:MAG: thioredoxin fold domain-containing protein [Cyanobacteria bacterium]|nr:thioredoxin fold domain-containing protein [Cyanobacteriota bacterium]
MTGLNQLLKKTLLSTLLGGVLLGQMAAGWATELPKELANAKANVTLLEFSAPWCLSCKKLKPEVEALQKELGPKLMIHHLNIEKPETQKYIELYKIESAPTFVLYDSKGKQLQRIEKDITPLELRTLIKTAAK